LNTTLPPEPQNITPVTIEEEMKRSYLDYAMSVIVARALPDVRDGLKPVHRRILYAMKEEGYEWNRAHKKSARIVGDVMGKYHPHGDAAIYDAMVRMAQEFSMRLPLVDGQGNYGSMDGDPAAAMRYTEARLAKPAHALLEDIDKETVDFQDNYDNSLREPVVLPAQFPNLLVNGASGIAVGMATNIPPHNLGEVIDACCAYIDNPEITVDELMEHVPGPDFPTGGIILGKTGIREAYRTGRGSLVVRGKVAIEDIRKDRQAIVVTEIPYQLNKSRLLERIAELVRDKQIEGISDLRDESDRDGVRVVVELKRDAQSDVVMNQLFTFTPLQSTFGVMMLALDGGKPETMNLRQIIAAFVDFREHVITRRTIFKLGKARERAHVLVGLAIAVANLDAVIKLIREARDPEVAKAGLMARAWPASEVETMINLIDEPGRKIEGGTYKLSEIQAKAILELRLQRLTGLERDKIGEEIKGLAEEIIGYLELLRSHEKLYKLLRDELLVMKSEFATPRRTELADIEVEQNIENLIQREDMVVTVSHGGYIKRVPLSTYRAQKRGGKGRAAMATREEDFVSRVFVADTHVPMLFFSSRGMVYKSKVWQLPIGTPQARGKALVNMLPLTSNETITTVMLLPEDESSWADMFIMFATAEGNVRRNRLSDFTSVMANGKIAMKLEGNDKLVGVSTCSEHDDVLLASRQGNAIRFSTTDVRVFSGRSSVGVRGMRLDKGDEVISMSILRDVEVGIEERESYLRLAGAMRRAEGDVAEDTAAGDIEKLGQDRFDELHGKEEFILSVSERGFGKRTSAYEYRITNRGGKGIANMELTNRTGPVVAAFPVAAKDQVMLVTDGGQIIRCPVHDIRIARRQTQGVILFKVAEAERVVSVTRLADEGDPVEAEPENGTPGNGTGTETGLGESTGTETGPDENNRTEGGLGENNGPENEAGPNGGTGPGENGAGPRKPSGEGGREGSE
jgi:DNA gyrase subunit A